MSINKTNIKYNANEMYVKFAINSSDKFIGDEQEILNLTSDYALELINPINDAEKRRFKNTHYTVPNKMNLLFTTDGSVYDNSYVTAGFDSDEIGYNSKFYNSFFIFDLYDGYEPYKQSKISATYITKIGNNSTITVDRNSQSFYFYLPISFIEKNIQTGIFGVIAYIKVSFFNAKTGKVCVFMNSDINSTTPLKQYFPIFIDFYNKLWRFNPVGDVTGKQLYIANDNLYDDKINNNFSKFDLKKQTYNVGNAFDTQTGKYEII